MNNEHDLRSQALRVLQEQFGLANFRQGQKSVIHRILQGKNAAAVFPTGGGKSLCYQLPSLLLPGTTVVVSPLIALMKDQCDALMAKGIMASRLDSSQSANEIRETFRNLQAGKTKILYLAPERFFNERFLASIRKMTISLFAIDEAHCISQWGHHFRPDYLKLAALTKQLGVHQVLALTATATPAVLDDIRKAFNIKKNDAIRTKFYRPNLKLLAHNTTTENQYQTLLSRIRNQQTGATLVYVTLQKTAEEIASYLREDGCDAIAYHAGMENETRNEIQKAFLRSRSKIIVATIAFGMGIDKPDIRNVYHFNAPKSLEGYAQEIGRAGRDGKKSTCEMLLTREDRIVLENFSYGDTPAKQSIHDFIEIIHGQSEIFHLSHHKLANETNIRLTVLRTLMTYLELDGWIEATSPRYESYRLKPLVSSQVILSQYEGEQRQFVGELLSCLTKGRIWFSLNLTIASKRLKRSREVIIDALNELGEQNWVEIKVADLTFGYRWKKRFTRLGQLASQLNDRLLKREADDIQRTAMVFDLAAKDQCYAAALSQHFGEILGEQCGNCSACLEQKQDNQLHETQSQRPIGTSAKKMLEQIVHENTEVFHSARDRAKFLCGLSTPLMIRKRLTRHPAFGICHQIPFPQVLQQVTENDES